MALEPLPTRILIVEDQPDGLALLSQAIHHSFDKATISLAQDLRTARAMSAMTFDYALVDLRLPDGLSIDWLGDFKLKHPNTPAVVTSLYDDDDLVFAALRAGADGYLLKGDGLDALVAGLKKVLLGEPSMSPAIARKLITQFRAIAPACARSAVKAGALVVLDTSAAAATHAKAAPILQLSPREEEVLALIGTGLMIKQVAAKLDIGYHTVNDNIKSIYRKLGIHTRAQAAAEASRRGLVG